MTIAAPHADVALEVRGLTVVFGGVTAVDDLSLTVPTGSIRAVIGPNGAGKTTLLNCISGLARATQGTVLFRGVDVANLAAWRRVSAGIGRTFQNPSLVEGLSAIDNVAVGLFSEGGTTPFEDAIRAPRARRAEKAARERAMAALEELGIERHAGADVRTLPLGTRKLVDLARAWVLRPPLLLIDEPTSGLGNQEIEDVERVLARLRGECTIVVIAHHLEFVMNMADEVTVLNFGREVITGTPEAVSRSPEVVEVYIGTTA